MPCRLDMKRPMTEQGYEEQVASCLAGWGFLAPTEVVTRHAAYVAQAKDWGMTPIRCAKNLETKEMGR